MNLLYDEAEEDLRGAVRKLLADRGGPAGVLARVETDQPYDVEGWRRLAGELGVAGLMVPDELGGAGASVREAAVAAEELGRAVAPVPFLGSTVLATSALVATSGREDVIRALASGERTAALAVPLTTAPGAGFGDQVRVEGGTLRGQVRTVVDLEYADVVLVPARDADGPALYLVELPADGATVTPVTALDLTRRIADLELAGVPARRVAGGADATDALGVALLTGAGLLAAEQLGVARWCLDTTVDYAKTRIQFGRVIGSFQAVKHRLADLWAGVANGTATARAAADALATGAEDRELLVAVAASYCSDLAVLAAEECVQLHGGIGMTWEHPAHLYLGRAKSSQLALGRPDLHRATLAELVDLPAPVVAGG